MIKSPEFLNAILDSLGEHIAVIDNLGDILFVNHAWVVFGRNNTCSFSDGWNGVNYLKVCKKAARMGDSLAKIAIEGINSVIYSRKESFYFEYPCHSPHEARWFMMRVTSFKQSGRQYFVITHQNITERKLAEEKILDLSRVDALTGVYNRRYFDEFLHNEWERCARLHMPVSLAFIDLDYFKLINDTYGHQAGDECLREVGQLLKKFAKRPGDICARYGGEEFAILYGNTTLEQSKLLIDKLVEEVRALNIPNEKSPIMPRLTASIGLTAVYPAKDSSIDDLIKEADQLLYTAKQSGKNKALYSRCQSA
jgi:diguanylate cyclase (GGDEF)-like protein